MQRSVVALAIASIAVLGTGPARAQPDGAGPLVERLGRIDARLGAAIALVRTETVPRGFATTITSIDGDVAALGHVLPKLGAGPARGSVAYYGLRRADTKLATALRHVAVGEEGGADEVRSAGGDLEIVADELGRQGGLARLTARVRTLARRARALADAAALDRGRIRGLMVEKDSLVRALPALAGVPFGRFYAQSGVLHARLGHALRTTSHDEPSEVLKDLLGAREVTRALEAAFRKAPTM